MELQYIQIIELRGKDEALFSITILYSNKKKNTLFWNVLLELQYIQLIEHKIFRMKLNLANSCKKNQVIVFSY